MVRLGFGVVIPSGFSYQRGIRKRRKSQDAGSALSMNDYRIAVMNGKLVLAGGSTRQCSMQRPR